MHVESGTQHQRPDSTGPGCWVTSATPTCCLQSASCASFTRPRAGCPNNGGVTFTEGSLHATLESTIPGHALSLTRHPSPTTTEAQDRGTEFPGEVRTRDRPGMGSSCLTITPTSVGVTKKGAAREVPLL